MYKLGSLFDGAGGFPLAGSLCGIEPVWAAEVEPYPIAVTRSRFPEMKHLGDISKVNGAEIEPVDIITFGSPCQDLSVAGKRAGLKHEANGDDETTRSGLFMEAVRIIKEMREATGGEFPRWALFENVPGAFSSQKGEDFRVVLEELIRIVEPGAVMPSVPKAGWAYADSYTGDGWSLAYRVFDAQYWGVPQRRRRINLVFDFRGECAREVLFEREGLRGYFAEGRTPWQGVAGDAQDCAGADDREGENRVFAAAVTLEPGIAAREDGHIYEGVSGTLRAEPGDNRMAVAYTLKIRSGCDGGGKGALIQEDKSATLATNNLESAGFNYLQGSKAKGIGYETEKAGTLRAGQFGDAVLVSYPEASVRYIVRRFTPTECARLQGFADRWGSVDEKDSFTPEEFRFWHEVRNTHAAINGKAVKEYTEAQMLTWYNKLHTDSSEYKMWGNGIALPPALYCMQGIVDAMGKEMLKK